MTANFRTAYEEALGRDREEEAATFSNESGGVDFSVPSYMVAADSHSIANGNKTFLESAVDTVSNIPKFVGLSIISGSNQIYNIPASVGNMFGGDFDTSGPDDFIAGLDSDLGAYYQENKEGIDLGGFLASSWIPGMAGIKVLHAGQASLRTAMTANKFGENTSKALGLLVPNKQRHLQKALKQAVNKDSVPSLINRNVAAAAGAGLTQATYEAAFFEMAVAATMSDSPILEGQDLGDFATNIAVGAGLFGVVGGGVGAVKSYYATKNIAKLADKETSPWKFAGATPSKANPYETIALDLQQLSSMPAIPAAGLTVGKDATHIEAATIKRFADEKVVGIENNIRKELGRIAEGDEELAEIVYQASRSASPEKRLSSFIGMKTTSRLAAGKTAVEKEVDKLAKKITGKDDIEALAAIERDVQLNVAYQRTWGAGIGEAFDELPAITSVTDLLKKGQKIEIEPTRVIAGSKSWKFNTKTPWNIFTSNPLQANARHLWAQKLKPFPESTAKKPVIVDEYDIPMMEKAYKEFSPTIKIRAEDGTLSTYSDPEAFFNRLVEVKEEVGVKLLDPTLQGTPKPRTTAIGKKAPTPKTPVTPLGQDEIESMVNVRNGYLTGVRSESITFDTLALDSYAQEYTSGLVASGMRKESAGLVDITEIPQTVKLSYDSKGLAFPKGHEAENMIRIKEMQKLYQQGTTNAFNDVIGVEAQNFEGLLNAQSIQESVNRISPGAGGATAASSDYGTVAAETEWLGKTVIRIIEKFQASAREALEPVLFKLGQSQQAAIEYATISNTLRSIPDNYVLNEAGDAMVPEVLKNWERKAAEATALGKAVPERPTLTALDAPESIPIGNGSVADLFRVEHELNGAVIDNYRKLRTAQGVQYTRSSEAYYPIPVNPRDYKHFALVHDNSITGTGHTKTLYASTAEELKEMAAKLKNDPSLEVRFKGDAEDFYRARGAFEYEKTLSDNYLDAAMYRKGVSSSYFVPTDPKKIINDTLNWHLQRASGLVREAVAVRFEVQFEELRRLGAAFTKGETSQFSAVSTVKHAEEVIKNPYVDYIKTALGIRKYSDYPFLVKPNRYADEAYTALMNRATRAMETAKTQVELDEVNAMLKAGGYKGAAYDETSDLFANHQAKKALLTSTVQKANSVIATVVLRWDSLNAVNNAISANVLLGAETASIVRAIRGSGDTQAWKEFEQIAKIAVPGSDRSMVAAGKMIARSMKRFGTNTPEMQWYREHGYISSISDQYRKTLDDLTFTAKESVEGWNTRVDGVHKTLREAANTGEKWTGNRLAEEFNRFVAADVMKQMTDGAVGRGIISSQQQKAYINTFVNRTQGNYLAAQRPMMFQGPIGQAIGLFQTYQFNLMQQLLRHVGEGTVKDSISLLALQGTIHGMNGMPAFNAINTHIVGSASGNTSHRDIYDTVYGVTGKQGGNWLMYGLGSNWLLHPDLKVNLYVRGDINPRHLTIVPTDPSQVPAVQATGKFLANLFETAGKLAAGGDVVGTLLQGLEHNGISRPLAGLAQTLEGLENPLGKSYSTSKQGNVIAANDLLSLANLGRMIGGKPLDEAIALDTTFRLKAYGLEDTKRRRNLGEAIKTSMIAGKSPSQEQIESYAEKYSELGGKQEQFNKWFTQLYKTANLSQANKLQRNLNSPFSQSMQKIMGGYELRDFSE